MCSRGKNNESMNESMNEKVAVTRVDKNEFFSDEKELIT